MSILSVVVLVIVVGAQEGPKMFLCADSTTPPSAKEKLVYGYIDGKKTGCMTEYEFLALYGKAVFDRDSLERAKQHEEAMQKAKVTVTRSEFDELVEQIKNGKKDLASADLMGADLQRADLSGATLTSADLRRAKLAYVNFTGANLEAAYCRKADMRGANFEKANLKSVFFGETDLRGAQGLSTESLRNVATLYKAKLDTALQEQVKEELPEKLKEPSKCWEKNAWTDNDDCKPSAPQKKQQR